MTEAPFPRLAPGEYGDVTDGVSAADLLSRPVRARGITLAEPVDLVLDLERMRAIGLEVACGDESRRFLPLAVATLSDDEIDVPSALLLLDERDLAFYRRRATTLAAVRGRPVERGRALLGLLADVVLDRDGLVLELVLETDRGTQRIAPADDLRILAGTRPTAA